MVFHDSIRIDYLKDAERLSVVRRLDRETMRKDPSFERIVEAVSTELDVDAVHVSVLDGSKQYLIAARGIDESTIPIQRTVCKTAVVQREILIVDDLRDDERFRGNPYVTAANELTFYAGLPIILDGHAVGTLCMLARHGYRVGVNERAKLFSWLRQVETQAAFHLELSRASSGADASTDEVEESSQRSRKTQVLIDHMLHGAVNLAASARSDASFVRGVDTQNPDAWEEGRLALMDIELSLTGVCETLKNARSLLRSPDGELDSMLQLSMRRMFEDVLELFPGFGEGESRVISVHQEKDYDILRADPKLLSDCIVQLVQVSLNASSATSDVMIRIGGDDSFVRAEINFDGDVEELRQREADGELVDAHELFDPTAEQTIDFCACVAEAHAGRIDLVKYPNSSSIILELPAA